MQGLPQLGGCGSPARLSIRGPAEVASCADDLTASSKFATMMRVTRIFNYPEEIAARAWQVARLSSFGEQPS